MKAKSTVRANGVSVVVNEEEKAARKRQLTLVPLRHRGVRFVDLLAQERVKWEVGVQECVPFASSSPLRSISRLFSRVTS